MRGNKTRPSGKIGMIVSEAMLQLLTAYRLRFINAHFINAGAYTDHKAPTLRLKSLPNALLFLLY